MQSAEVRPDGTTMRWVEFPGTEPPRVYLHGLGSCSVAYYAMAASHPALAGTRSLMVDLLGFGLSDRPTDAEYTLEQHADLVAALLTQAGVAAADVIAHSMGGLVAILLAERHPHLVRRLVLVDTHVDRYPPGPGTAWQIANQTEEAFLREGWTTALAAAGPHWAATMRLAGPTALYRTTVGLFARTGPTMREILLNLPIPRAMLRPAVDGPLDDADQLVDAGIQLVAVPGCGHNIMIDNVEGFVAAVAACLAGPTPA